MSQAYLPGNTRQRIQDLIKDSSITQAELASIIGLSESALSRYLKGLTEMLGDGYIIKIAKHFNVSTDFLLGETDIPDRKNYDIEELGISAEAAKLLYTGRLDSRVLNLLLENPHFPQLLALLARYQKEIVRSGIAAMNQQLTFINSLLLAQAESVPDSAGAATQLAADLRGVRMPVINADTTAIQNLFMLIVSIDAPLPGFDSETNVTYADILPDDYNKNPEQLFIRKETITEVRNALGEISDRERAYLHYRFGFLDYVLHDQSETAAHFHLSLSRARHTEKAALKNVRCTLSGFIAQNTEMNRASTGHSSFPYSVCFIKV